MTAAGSTGPGEKRVCGARKKQGTGICTRPAGWGTDHVGFGNCKLHGGSTPNGSKHAASERDRETKANVSALLEAYGVDARDVSDVYVLLGEMVGRMVGLVDLFERKASELDGLVADGEHGESERVMLKLYRETVRDTSALLRDVAKLDIEERRLRLDAKRAEVVAGLLRQVLSDPRVGLTAERQQVVLGVFGELARAQEAQ